MGIRYFRPLSLTWWAGVFSFTIGLLTAFGAGQWATEFGALIGILSGGGDASPAQLMGLGIGLIGLRDKLARVFDPDI